LIKGVILDWDGTLADTKKVAVASFQTVLKSLKINVTDQFIIKRMGTSAREIFKDILKDTGKNFDDEILQDLVKKRIKAEINLSGEVKLNECALHILGSLKTSFKLALATMNNGAVITHLLDSLGIGLYFDVVLSADDVQKSKPDPEIFLKCASRLDLSPDCCAVIEDSIFGVEAAKHSGMKCIAVTTGAYSKEELEKKNADLVVSTLCKKQKIFDLLYDADPC
jgi:beta-phosphoglucomutase